MASLDPARRRTLHSWTTDQTTGPCNGMRPTPAVLIDLASNDYLGLSRHAALIDAATRAVRDGAGSGGSGS